MYRGFCKRLIDKLDSSLFCSSLGTLVFILFIIGGFINYYYFFLPENNKIRKGPCTIINRQFDINRDYEWSVIAVVNLTVDNKSYVNVFRVDPSYTDRETAQEVYNNMPVNTKITCYYNYKDPSKFQLREIITINYYGLVFFVIALFELLLVITPILIIIKIIKYMINIIRIKSRKRRYTEEYPDVIEIPLIREEN
jgi:hypothetical protein